MRLFLRRAALLFALCAAIGGALHLPHAHADGGTAHSCPCLMPAAQASEALAIAAAERPLRDALCEGERLSAASLILSARSRAPPAA